MRGSKPGERRGGRRAGTPNKITSELREMVLEALDRAGGVEYLATQAAVNPTAFLSLVGKLLPRENKPEGTDRLTLGDLIDASIAHRQEETYVLETHKRNVVPLLLPSARG